MEAMQLYPPLHQTIEAARLGLERVLNVAQGAPHFELGVPLREELRAIAKALLREHASDDHRCDLVASADGFENFEKLQAAMAEAWRREELLVLHQSPGGGATKYMASCDLDDAGRACELLLRPVDRWVVPAFATVCVKAKRVPYIELLWVAPRLRRLGIGSLMVREICQEQPCIKRVRSCLLEALPFWDAVGAHVSRCPHHTDLAITRVEDRAKSSDASGPARTSTCGATGSGTARTGDEEDEICAICGWFVVDCQHC